MKYSKGLAGENRKYPVPFVSFGCYFLKSSASCSFLTCTHWSALCWRQRQVIFCRSPQLSFRMALSSSSLHYPTAVWPPQSFSCLFNTGSLLGSMEVPSTAKAWKLSQVSELRQCQSSLPLLPTSQESLSLPDICCFM